VVAGRQTGCRCEVGFSPQRDISRLVRYVVRRSYRHWGNEALYCGGRVRLSADAGRAAAGGYRVNDVCISSSSSSRISTTQLDETRTSHAARHQVSIHVCSRTISYEYLRHLALYFSKVNGCSFICLLSLLFDSAKDKKQMSGIQKTNCAWKRFW